MADRVQRQAEAERAVRRGELKQALGIYRELLEQAPDDLPLRSRMATIESLLQPQELSAAPVAHPNPGPDFSRPSTLEQTAEALFEHGDLAGAIQTYERILRERPDHDLARERSAELQRLFEVGPRPSSRPPTVEVPAVQPLPPGRSAMLEALLARIAKRRKP